MVKKLLFLVACLSQLVCVGEVDQYFNGGETVSAENAQTSDEYESGVTVDLYDNVISFYWYSTDGILMITKVKENGELDLEFGFAGSIFIALSDESAVYSDFKITTDPVNGDVFIAYKKELGGFYFVYIHKYLAHNGLLDGDFGTDGIASAQEAIGHTLVALSGISINSENELVIIGLSSAESNYFISAWKLSSAGALETLSLRFHTNSVLDVGDFAQLYFFLDSYDRIYVGGIHGTGIYRKIFCIRFILNAPDSFEPDITFADDGIYSTLGESAEDFF